MRNLLESIAKLIIAIITFIIASAGLTIGIYGGYTLGIMLVDWVL